VIFNISSNENLTVLCILKTCLCTCVIAVDCAHLITLNIDVNEAVMLVTLTSSDLSCGL